jgi:hypothetical protein
LAPAVVSAWFEALGVDAGEVRIDGYMTSKLESAQNHDFVQGWSGADALSVLANAAEDDHLRDNRDAGSAMVLKCICDMVLCSNRWDSLRNRNHIYNSFNFYKYNLLCRGDFKWLYICKNSSFSYS